ncbi:MAG TPA: hypothetical protein V6C58_14215 [Allocoleopsis sp.]
MASTICVSQTIFFLFIFILIISMLGIIVYIAYMDSVKPNTSNVDNNIITKLTETLGKAINTSRDLDTKYLQPERKYIPPNIYSYGISQQVGFIYNSNSRFPLYEERDDKNYNYYIIDETRNSIKIPFDTPRSEQVTDGQVINIPILGGDFTVKLYEYQQYKYNPNII